MNKASFVALMLTASAVAQAQTPPPSDQAAFEAMLKNLNQNTYKLNGTCKSLLTPTGDLTKDCESELISMAFASGNSSFIATIKGKGGISFRGRDSAAVGDTAVLDVSMILLTGTDLSPPVMLKATGKCTYTNPNAGPVQVECAARTEKGEYKLSYVSDGIWPPN